MLVGLTNSTPGTAVPYVQELGVLALLPLSPMRAAEEAARSLPSAAKEEAPTPSTPAQLKRIERPAAAPSNENGGGDAADDADDGGDSAWQETPDAKRVRLLKVKAARLRRAGRHADAVAALNAAQTLEMRTARAKARRSNGSGDTPSSATMERRQTISALFSE